MGVLTLTRLYVACVKQLHRGKKQSFARPEMNQPGNWGTQVRKEAYEDTYEDTWKETDTNSYPQFVGS